MDLQSLKKQLTAQFYRGNLLIFSLAVFAALAGGSLNLIVSWIMQQLIDAASGIPGALSLGTLAKLTGGFVLLCAAFFLLKYASEPRFIERAMRQYKDFAFRKLTEKSISSFREESTAAYLSALTNDAGSIEADYRGQILLDGTELRNITPESLYEMMSVIQQNVFVFNASIKDNVSMFREFPQRELDEAIRYAHLSELLAERGEGYLCGENGSGLSGGEKQRISIARSLLKKSSVLLADEVTAALDAQTAHQVSGDILDLHGMTRIVVTHTLEEALLRRYDGILVLKNGEITEAGSFDELMAKKGYFYALYTVSQ